ncbi:hypothetical protein [Nitrosomonas sp.]|uniref:hypothetical protein n=1 Tax=Nitrosomonas sp. TaxID=42353 RepID=UPI0025D08116|nr:hypothetical protein [Nitrosomonas sp.]
MTIERVWRDAMQGERMSHSKAMATTNNAAVCPPDAIQVLQLFMNDSLARDFKMPPTYKSLKPA